MRPEPCEVQGSPGLHVVQGGLRDADYEQGGVKDSKRNSEYPRHSKWCKAGWNSKGALAETVALFNSRPAKARMLDQVFRFFRRLGGLLDCSMAFGRGGWRRRR